MRNKQNTNETASDAARQRGGGSGSEVRPMYTAETDDSLIISDSVFVNAYIQTTEPPMAGHCLDLNRESCL